MPKRFMEIEIELQNNESEFLISLLVISIEQLLLIAAVVFLGSLFSFTLH